MSLSKLSMRKIFLSTATLLSVLTLCMLLANKAEAAAQRHVRSGTATSSRDIMSWKERRATTTKSALATTTIEQFERGSVSGTITAKRGLSIMIAIKDDTKPGTTTSRSILANQKTKVIIPGKPRATLSQLSSGDVVTIHGNPNTHVAEFIQVTSHIIKTHNTK